MKKHCDEDPDWDAQRDRIIGLGETSIRKNYFPLLQQRIAELEKKNRELQAAYAEQTASGEELRQQFEETARAEQDLRESEERFRSLIEASPVPIILARDGVFLYANSAFVTMLGYDTPEEIVGKKLLDFISPEFQATIAEYIQARIQGKPAESYYESVGIRRDGSRFPYEITVSVIRLRDGPVTMAFINDITDRKRSEEALARSGERLRRAELVAGLGHWEFDLDAGTVYASDGARTLYGLSGPYCRISDVQKIPLSEYRPLLDNALRALVDNNKPYDIEFRILRPTDNAIIDIHSIAEYDPGKRVVFGVIQDVTVRKRAEELLRESEKKFRSIVETTPDIVWELDATGAFTYVSPQCFALLGYEESHLLGKPFFMLVPEEDRLWAAGVFAQQVSVHTPYLTVDSRALHRDGSELYVEIRSASVMDENGDLIGFRGIARDITDRKRQERILQSQLDLGLTLEKNLDLKETLHACLWAAIRISEMDAGGIYLVDEISGAADLAVSQNLGDEFVKFISHYPTDSANVRLIMAGKPLYVPYSKTGVTHAGVLEREGLLATGIIPILSNGTPIACINIASHTIEEIPVPSRAAVEMIANQIGNAIERNKAGESLRISEARYRSLVDVTDTGYVVLDESGRVVDANEVYLRLTGRDSIGDIIGHTVTEWTAPYDLERNGHEIEKCIRTGSVRGLEIDYVRPDGFIQPIELNATVFAAGNSNVILTLCRDISDRKQTQGALQQARNKLNLLNTVTFQDIQTSAFSLSAYQELIKPILTDAKAKSYLEKQQLFLKKMVDTLDFARNYQEMGIHPPRWQNVQQVFLYAISHLDFLHMKQDLELDRLEIFADPLFEKALFNIMENVLDHGVHATEVRLRYEIRDAGLTLIISDNGVGISPAEKNMIFDRGYGRGTGLGLFLVREVLSITGMSIRESGVAGQGTRFEITVPKGSFRFTG
jgi:PAS domain S-box-containing protein